MCLNWILVGHSYEVTHGKSHSCGVCGVSNPINSTIYGGLPIEVILPAAVHHLGGRYYDSLTTGAAAAAALGEEQPLVGTAYTWRG